MREQPDTQLSRRDVVRAILAGRGDALEEVYNQHINFYLSDIALYDCYFQQI